MNSPMTPEQAQNDLEWAQALARNESGGGDWEDVCETLVRALDTIAGMKEEWGVEFTAKNNLGRRTSWIYRETSDDSYAQALRECGIYERKGMEPRLVRRYVTQVIDSE